MPRYFFNVRDGQECLDREGTVLLGPGEARSQAVVGLGELLKDNLRGRFWDDPDWRMWVSDEGGATVCSLSVSGE